MVKRFANINLMSCIGVRLVCLVATFLLGCEKKALHDNIDPEPKQTNVTALVSQKCSKGTSLDQNMALKMTEALDTDDHFTALRYARQLMDSSDFEVRSSVVTTLGWIGRKALPEIESMLADADDRIRQEALMCWEVAIEEVPNERTRAHYIVRAATSLDNKEMINAVLHKLTMIDEKIARDTVDRILLSQPNGFLGRALREIREMLSGE